MMERRPAAAMRLWFFMQNGGVGRWDGDPGDTLPMYCAQMHIGRARKELFGEQREALDRLLEQHPRCLTVIAVTDLGRARQTVRDFERWCSR